MKVQCLTLSRRNRRVDVGVIRQPRARASSLVDKRRRLGRDRELRDNARWSGARPVMTDTTLPGFARGQRSSRQAGTCRRLRPKVSTSGTTALKMLAAAQAGAAAVAREGRGERARPGFATKSLRR